MKSIEEIKEEVARSSGFPNWKNVELHNEELSLFNEVIVRYAQQYINANKGLVEMLEHVKGYLGSDQREIVESLITKHKQS